MADGQTMQPPLSLVISKLTSEAGHLEIKRGSDPVLTLNGGLRLHGDRPIAVYLARSSGLYPESHAAAAADVDQYLALCEHYAAALPDQMEQLTLHLEARMVSRTCLVGHQVSIADVALWLLYSGRNRDSEKAPNMCRWLDYVGAVYSLPQITKACEIAMK